MCTGVCTCIHIHICKIVHVFVFARVCGVPNIYIYIYIYIYLYIYLYIYVGHEWKRQ